MAAAPTGDSGAASGANSMWTETGSGVFGADAIAATLPVGTLLVLITAGLVSVGMCGRAGEWLTEAAAAAE